MEPNRDHELVLQIDPKRQRFPCCIVWTPLPVISWLVPFIGHIGICREDGIILDFAGPNFVSVDNFAFGSVARYIQISPKKQCSFSAHSAAYDSGDVLAGNEEESITTWDDALRKSTQEFQHHAYNLLTCNCHSFVVNNLNRLGFQTGGWNLVNLAVLIFLKGTWVSKRSVARTVLPFVVVCSLGIMLGGSSFLTFFLFFNPALKSNREENRSRKMGDGQVISCHTLKAWRQELEKNKNSKKLVVVDFTALWCGPCRLIEPSIAALAKKLHSVAFLKVDVDEVMYVASQWSVETLPTIVVLKEGKLVGKIVGANVNKLQETIAMNLTAT